MVYEIHNKKEKKRKNPHRTEMVDEKKIRKYKKNKNFNSTLKIYTSPILHCGIEFF